LFSLFVFLVTAIVFSARTTGAETPRPIRYFALGDSYTIGEGVREEDRFPNQLVNALAREGIFVELAGNPSRTGWTTDELIRYELPVFDVSKASFVTLLIGVNDFVHGSSPEEFRSRLRSIIDHVKGALPGGRGLVLVTIPDFSVTPAGAHFGSREQLSSGIKAFNTVIAEEGARAHVPVADIYSASLAAASNRALVADDGLHPSAEQYASWVPILAEAARPLFVKPR
jgi:lysophospholipase L1-like esterase